MKPQLAISYIRYSTTAQSYGDSLRRQVEKTEAYCKKHGLILTDAYRLRDLGKSAYKGINRSPTGALGQLEKQVKEGKIPKGTVLVVENLDRLTREDIVTAQLLLLNLINDGLEIVALSDNERRYSRESLALNPMDLVVSIAILSRGHEESKTKGGRVKDSWLIRYKAAAEGKHINIKLPAWLESKDGSYLAIPEKAAVIKRIFKLYLTAYGTQTIATIFCNEKVPNIARDRQGRSDRWHPTYIQRILKSKQVIGFYTGGSLEVPNFFPAIVSESDFYAAQAKLKERYNYKGQRNSTPQPFSHLIKCARCGESIVKAHGNGYRFLQCQGARVKLCASTTLPYKATEQVLLRVIASTDATTFSIDDDAAMHAQQEIDSMQGKLRELEQKLLTAGKLFVDTPSEAGAKILQTLEADKNAINKQLEDTRNSYFLADHRADWKAVKARIDADIEKAGGILWEVIPVSVKMTNGNADFLRHQATRAEDDVIALREALKSQIEKIEMDIPQMRVTIHCKSGKHIPVELKKSNSYPRQLFYRTDHTAWIGMDPALSK